ncbi:histidine phosphatase superfamily [Xylaria bambusicola]|uniref:histidine phosphatase superfamily n=1 Tax=Xylaria bambusicola TaxID=326684 RepID=UPI002007C04A|nr:histidine phosphatase superfamily [Xylaria bambusicola]KAI0516854.1 histidine phosphatase superfamily [Xylaria bambusicola]
MPATIWLVRHAESVANATRNGDIHDPELTDLGRAQCVVLREKFARKHVDLTFVSPMQRAIQTALEIFPESSGRPTDPMVLLPELQERGSLSGCTPCDIGSPPDVLLEK